MIEINNQKVCEQCFGRTEQERCPECGFERASYESDPAVLKVGSILENRYMIGGVIGKGGFGITYLAYDMKLDYQVAVKEYYPYGIAIRDMGSTTVSATSNDTETTFQEGAKRFYEEARMVAKFNENPNIVSVHDFFYANDTVYFVMGFLRGQTLKSYIDRHGVLTPEQAVFLADAVCNALEEVHKAGILHRDISPDNIMLCNDGTVKLLDFGAARQVAAEGSQSLSVILKQGFAPLEQYQKKGKQGPWTDIYSLGATLYYAMTKDTLEDPMTRLEDDEDYSANKHGIPEKLWQVIQKATMLKSSERYQNVHDLKEEIHNTAVWPKGFDNMESLENKVEFVKFSKARRTGTGVKAETSFGVSSPSVGSQPMKEDENQTAALKEDENRTVALQEDENRTVALQEDENRTIALKEEPQISSAKEESTAAATKENPGAAANQKKRLLLMGGGAAALLAVILLCIALSSGSSSDSGEETAQTETNENNGSNSQQQTEEEGENDSASQTKQTNYVKYVNNNVKFSVDYPEGYNVTEQGTNTALIVNDNNADFQVSIEYAYQRTDGGFIYSAKDFYTQMQADISVLTSWLGAEEVDVTNSGEDVIAGKPCYFYEFGVAIENQQHTGKLILFDCEGDNAFGCYSYLQAVNEEAADAALYKEQLAKMADSFQITGPHSEAGYRLLTYPDSGLQLIMKEDLLAKDKTNGALIYMYPVDGVYTEARMGIAPTSHKVEDEELGEVLESVCSYYMKYKDQGKYTSEQLVMKCGRRTYGALSLEFYEEGKKFNDVECILEYKGFYWRVYMSSVDEYYETTMKAFSNILYSLKFGDDTATALKEQEERMSRAVLNNNDAGNANQKAPEQPQQSGNGLSNEDYVLPESNSKFYQKSDLDKLTREEIKLARNEIYARHGRKFTVDMTVKAYFEGKSWYRPTVDEVPESMLNEYEIANRDLILAYEKEKGWE